MSDDKMAYSVDEAARLLGVSERTMRSQITAERVRVVRIGARVLVPRTELEMLLRDQKEPIPAAR